MMMKEIMSNINLRPEFCLWSIIGISGTSEYIVILHMYVQCKVMQRCLDFLEIMLYGYTLLRWL